MGRRREGARKYKHVDLIKALQNRARMIDKAIGDRAPLDCRSASAVAAQILLSHMYQK